MDPWSPCSPPPRPVRRSFRAGPSGRSRSSGTVSGRSRTPRRASCGCGAARSARSPSPTPSSGGLAGIEDAVLDGEIVLMADGIPSFTALAERMHVRDVRRAAALAARQPVTFMVFDVLRLAGDDLTRAPYDERRAILDRLALPQNVQLSPVYPDGAGALGRDRAARARRRRGEAALVDLPAGPPVRRLGQGAPPAHARRARLRLAGRRPPGRAGSARCCSALATPTARCGSSGARAAG